MRLKALTGLAAFAALGIGFATSAMAGVPAPFAADKNFVKVQDVFGIAYYDQKSPAAAWYIPGYAAQVAFGLENSVCGCDTCLKALGDPGSGGIMPDLMALSINKGTDYIDDGLAVSIKALAATDNYVFSTGKLNEGWNSPLKLTAALDVDLKKELGLTALAVVGAS